MHNYHLVKLWHEQYDSKSAASRGDGAEDAELAFNRNYVHQKLEHGLLRVWRVRIATVLVLSGLQRMTF